MESGVVDLDDAWVRERCQDSRLTELVLAGALVGRQDLKRGWATNKKLARFVDVGESTTP